jgi:nucleoside-diphosphate-sugar epimerase
MKKLLFTGGSGFIGRNILDALRYQYVVKTLGVSTGNDYNFDLSKMVPVFYEQFDIILHAAGKAHTTPRNNSESEEFFNVNFKGTKQLCKALENSGLPSVFIFISSVAVYGVESGINITEEHPLSGTSPYAKSKILAEQYLEEWCNKNNVKLGIIRPSLIAGPNPPGNLYSMIKGIKTGRYLSIAGGKARKSILMVQDIINILPALIEKGGKYNICDDKHPSFKELEILISKQLGKKEPMSIPLKLAKLMAMFGDLLGDKAPFNTSKLEKITLSLTFSNDKAKKELNWQPLNVLDNFVIY